MKRLLKIFYLFSKYSLKSQVQSKIGVFLFTIGKIVRFVTFFYFIHLLVSSTGVIKGYTPDQAILFYLTFNIIDSTAQILFREVYRFRPLIISGELNGILIKPYHPFVRVLLGGIDFLDIIMLVPYIIITGWYIHVTGTYSLASLSLYILLILNSLVIATAFHIFVLAMSLVTTEVDHTIMIYRDITNTARFPIEIYKEPVRFILTFVIPVGIMMSVPAQGLFGVITTPLLIASFGLSFFFLNFSVWFWNKNLKYYQSWGG